MTRSLVYLVLAFILVSAGATLAQDPDGSQSLVAEDAVRQPLEMAVPRIQLRSRIITNGKTEFASISIEGFGPVSIWAGSQASTPMYQPDVQHRFELRPDETIRVLRRTQPLTVDYYQKTANSPDWNGPHRLEIYPQLVRIDSR